MGRIAKRRRMASEEPSEEDSQDESGSEKTISIDEAALHTIWDAEAAKKILLKIAKEPALGVFGTIRSTWGKGVEIEKDVQLHFDGMYDSGYAEPCWGNGIFDMLQGTRELAEKLLEVKEYDAAFFFAHGVAAMIRRCEAEEAKDPDQQEDAIKWAKALDGLMAEAVKGWRKEAGNSKKQKAEITTLVKAIETGEHAKGYDQTKWYPNTLEGLRAWAK